MKKKKTAAPKTKKGVTNVSIKSGIEAKKAHRKRLDDALKGKVKYVFILFAILCSFLINNKAMAAGSCVLSSALFGDTDIIAGLSYNTEHSIKRVTYLCTAHTDNSLSTTIETSYLNGWYGWRVIAKPGTTAPTTDSDLDLQGSISGLNYLDSAGNGANLVDDTDTRWDYFEGPPADGSLNDTALFWTDDPIQVDLSNNGVASATFYLVFFSIKE